MVDFEARVERHARRLRHLEIDRLVWVGDNSADWPVIELAALRAGVAFIPLPIDAPPELIDYTARLTRADALLTERPDRVAHIFGEGEPLPPTGPSEGWRIEPSPTGPALPAETARLTLTRGITGPPRAVAHSTEQIWSGTRTLHRSLATGRYDVHLALLPLSRLAPLQWTVLGPLLVGGRAVLPALAPLGLLPGGTPDASAIADLITEQEPTTLLVTPRVLRSWLDAIPPKVRSSRSSFARNGLRRVVSVGAPLPRSLHRRALELGLPIFEGYGLGECCGIVTMNSPSGARENTVGRFLPGIDGRIDDDGGLWVRGASPLGLLGEDGFSPTGDEVLTDDLGHIDADGYLTILGRAQHRVITEKGRRICPEWIEEVLQEQSAIARAFVVGHGPADLAAVLLPRPGFENDLPHAVARVNERLPEANRIAAWTAIDEPLSHESRTLTPSGHPDRTRIVERFGDRIA